MIRDVTTQAKLELALIENIQRKDLNPMEEAEAYQALIEEFGLTQEAVAERVGRNRVTVANALRLLQLPAEIQKSLRDGRITAGHAKVILSAPGPQEQLALWRKILKEDLTVRAGEVASQQIRHRIKSAKQAPEPILKRFEDALRRQLNTRVKITRRGRGGSITIDFYSQEELENITEKITGE
ncbi:MAG: ParB-like protein partition protein [Candidatus Giovannonibacteria bacterium GW2011_GWA2_53_7]|uniref:ParB-like protein partition protein n=1 Tax=Candidatus Giovannonibacteria bacterium GW2011_GWA2_53_7 TaxID=1618650 RepID=A0A0G1XWI0_9BACT|nr:MAG: ParB-like protein partition protein [Candidatus Giovannonibacteria bacterium GW2011_GWA2_53_7]